MTKREHLAELLKAAEGQARDVQVRRVAGAGGRMRTVAVCEVGHWHGNGGQAYRCKEALYVVGRSAQAAAH